MQNKNMIMLLFAGIYLLPFDLSGQEGGDNRKIILVEKITDKEYCNKEKQLYSTKSDELQAKGFSEQDYIEFMNTTGACKSPKDAEWKLAEKTMKKLIDKGFKSLLVNNNEIENYSTQLKDEAYVLRFEPILDIYRGGFSVVSGFALFKDSTKIILEDKSRRFFKKLAKEIDSKNKSSAVRLD